jgi:hypothetical protein
LLDGHSFYFRIDKLYSITDNQAVCENLTGG